jgi:predicted TIM-barrel fold metal-dependent hydrolase
VLPVAFVDAHHHFQDLERHYYPWLCDKEAPPKLEGDLTPIRCNYLVEDYLRDLDFIHLVKSVHVQNGWDARDPVGETRWLQELADREGFPHAIVAYADLAAPGVEALLEAHAAYPNVRGIRQVLNWHQDPILRVAQRADLMDDLKWRRGFALLQRYRLSFDLQIYWTQMDDAYRLARDFPDTLILLNHFGMPVDRSAEGVSQWARALARLAEAPNVIVKLSGLGLGHPGWTASDTVPLLSRAIELFGIERSMFGTNLPVDRLFAPAETAMRAHEIAARNLTEAERNALFRRNAERAYRI